MKDKATTSVIIAGKPEEAQSYHIGHGCWQPEEAQSTTLAMVARQTEKAQSYHSTSI